MDRVTLIIICLFVILFLGQLFLREYFVTTVDMSNSTITMSLSELLYTIGVGSKNNNNNNNNSNDNNDDASNTQSCNHTDAHNDTHDTHDLETYLMMKEELLNGVKSGINSALPSALKGSGGQAPLSMTDVSPSCSQGSSYMENVQLVAKSC